jgi:hypothetical protein
MAGKAYQKKSVVLTLSRMHPNLGFKAMQNDRMDRGIGWCGRIRMKRAVQRI